MYVIVRNISVSPSLMINEPATSGRVRAGMGEHAERSRGYIATSYLPLSDIAELQHTHSISGDNKGIEHLE